MVQVIDIINNTVPNQLTKEKNNMSADLQPIKDAVAAKVDEAFAMGAASVAAVEAPVDAQPVDAQPVSDKLYSQAEMDAALSDLKEKIKSAVAAEDADLQSKIDAL